MPLRSHEPAANRPFLPGAGRPQGPSPAAWLFQPHLPEGGVPTARNGTKVHIRPLEVNPQCSPALTSAAFKAVPTTRIPWPAAPPFRARSNGISLTPRSTPRTCHCLSLSAVPCLVLGELLFILQRQSHLCVMKPLEAAHDGANQPSPKG